MSVRTTAKLVVLSATVVLAGTSQMSTTGAASSRVRLGTPVKVSANSTGQSAAEPSIRAARDGTLYIVAPTGLGGVRIEENNDSGGDIIWRSDNGGRTWKFLGSYDDVAGGGDADIAPDHRGRLWGSGLTLVNTTATYSDDKGETFAVNPVGQQSALVDRQWIETYRSKPFAFMTTGEIGTRATILSRLELKAGNTPVPVDTITVSRPRDEYQWPGEIAVDERNGLVYTSYNTIGQKRNRDDIVVTRNRLGLGGLKRSKVTTTKGDSFDSFVAVDIDRAGNVYAVWSERRHAKGRARQGRTNSYIAVSRNKGKNFSKPVRLNRKPMTTTFPWVVAGGSGRVAVGYYGTETRGPSPENVARKGKLPPRWKVYLAYSTNATKATRRFTEITAVRKKIHEGNVCTSGTGCASGTRDLLDFFQIDLDPCGRVITSYTDNSRDTVKRGGNRTDNKPELIYFAKQKDGPRFYRKPLRPGVC